MIIITIIIIIIIIIIFIIIIATMNELGPKLSWLIVFLDKANLLFTEP